MTGKAIEAKGPQIHDRHGAVHGSLDGVSGGTPEQVDAGDVNDGSLRQPTGSRKNRAAQWLHTCSCHLYEWTAPATTLDGVGDSLCDKQPPWDHVAIPRIDADVDALLERIASNDRRSTSMMEHSEPIDWLRCTAPRMNLRSCSRMSAQRIPDSVAGGAAAWRRGLESTERFEQFILACEADARGLNGLEQPEYPQLWWLREARARVAAVMLDEATCAGLRGRRSRRA